MANSKFRHSDLEMVNPEFNSPIMDYIIDLDYLRKKPYEGTTHPQLFFQLKEIFHLLESLGSARIEGNNTTLSELIETTLEPSKYFSPEIQEIENIEAAIDFIENSINAPINRAFICEIHKKVTQGLPHKHEGDPTPGKYRDIPIRISQSNHVPPELFQQIDAYMDELFNFINNQFTEGKFDLLKTAIAHHRFTWIHPFRNGNGRTVRLLTYAMLVKQGFNVRGRIINPTAIFCIDRNSYYEHLAMADAGTKEGILAWCTYVLKGLKLEIGKIDLLADFSYLSREILFPALKQALKQKYINEQEYKILAKAVEKEIIQANDIKEFFPKKSKSEISRQIKLLVAKKMLLNEKGKSRRYLISFNNNLLLRVIVQALREKGFLSTL